MPIEWPVWHNTRGPVEDTRGGKGAGGIGGIAVVACRLRDPDRDLVWLGLRRKCGCCPTFASPLPSGRPPPFPLIFTCRTRRTCLHAYSLVNSTHSLILQLANGPPEDSRCEAFRRRTTNAGRSSVRPSPQYILEYAGRLHRPVSHTQWGTSRHQGHLPRSIYQFTPSFAALFQSFKGQNSRISGIWRRIRKDVPSLECWPHQYYNGL